jgi:hypothetical protein
MKSGPRRALSSSGGASAPICGHATRVCLDDCFSRDVVFRVEVGCRVIGADARPAIGDESIPTLRR